MEIKRVKIGVAVLVLCTTWLMQSCDQDYCFGFQGEPYFSMASDSTAFKIYATNGEVGDTIYSEDFLVRVPVDMNSDKMRYELYAPEYKGDIVLDYALQVDECQEDDQVYLFFSEAKFSEESTFDGFYYRDRRVTHGAQFKEILNTEGNVFFGYQASFYLRLK